MVTHVHLDLAKCYFVVLTHHINVYHPIHYAFAKPTSVGSTQQQASTEVIRPQLYNLRTSLAQSVGDWVRGEPRRCDSSCGIPGEVSCPTFTCDPYARPSPKQCPETAPCGTVHSYRHNPRTTLPSLMPPHSHNHFLVFVTAVIHVFPYIPFDMLCRVSFGAV